MAGPTLVVRFLGDLTGLGTALQGAQSKASTAAAGAHKAFSSFLSAVNKTGVLGPFAGALDGIDQVIGTMGEHGAKTGEKLAGIGLGLTTAGAVLSTFASKEQASHQQLQAAIKATGKSYDDYAGRIDNAIKKQENYGHTASETDDALRALTQATHDPAKALDLLGTASDVAAAKHESLSAAATSMGKVYNGNTRLLKEFGITAGETAAKAQKALETATKNATKADDAAAKAKQQLSDLQARLSDKSKITVADQQHLRDAQAKVTASTLDALGAHAKLKDAQDKVGQSANQQKDTMQKLADVTKGQAAASADTFRGKLDAMKARLEDAASTLGQKYGPALQTVGIALTALGSIYTVVAAAEWATLWPILAIIAGIALLVAAAYVIYRNWDTIWAAMKTAVEVVWNFIKDYWPLLLGILIGPMAIALFFIIKYFSQIKDAVSDAVSFIHRLWSDVANFLTGIAGTIWRALSGFWGAIAAAVAGATNQIKGYWNDVVGFVAGLPGRIGAAARGMWDGLYNAFKAVVNSIAHAWNSTIGAINVSIPSWVPGIGGKGFDVPNIPTLQQGGIVTSTGLILAHAGEAVTPIPNGGLGPSIHIENVNVSDELDLDSFMRRMAWNVRTAGV